jgi:hypothetical protein
MSPVTDAYVVAHAAEIHLAIALFAVVASISIAKLALTVDDLAKSLRKKFARSGSGRRSASRLDAVGVR